MSTGVDIITHLVNEGYGTLGTDIFLGFMPDQTNSIVVYESGGPSPYLDMGESSANYLIRPSFQIMVRNSSYSTGKANCDAILRTFMAIFNQSINGTYYQMIVSSGDINSLGKVTVTGGEAHEFSMNFRTTRNI